MELVGLTVLIPYGGVSQNKKTRLHCRAEGLLTPKKSKAKPSFFLR